MEDWIIIFFASKLHAVIVLIALVFVLYTKHLQKKILLLTFIALPLSFILSRIASYVYFNPRPFVIDGVIPLIQHAADNGFPSDHMLLVSIISAIIFVYDRKIGFILVLLSILVGLGRVLSGVHHTVDIVGSLIIAVSATCISLIFINTLVNKK